MLSKGDNDDVGDGHHRVGGIAGVEGLEFHHGEDLTEDLARTLHLEWELGMCTAGEATLTFEGGSVSISEGTLFVIAPHVAHSLTNVDKHAFCALRLDPTLVEDLIGTSPQQHAQPIVSHSEDSKLRWCWLCGQLLADQPRAIYESALGGALRAILLETAGEQRAPLPSRVEVMRSQLQTRLGEQVSLAELGESVELSQFHAARLFRAALGVSPHEYQILLRIAEAKRLLLRGQSVTDVAGQVGFSDQSHLHRYFKRYVHVTPANYRRWTLEDSKKIQAEIRERMESSNREPRVRSTDDQELLPDKSEA